MADETTIKKKKLPFKPTALLRKARAAKEAEAGGAVAEKNYDDLFYRGKEMEKILAADLERSVLKKKRQEAERKRKIEEQEEKEQLWEKMAEEQVKVATPAKKTIVPILNEDEETEAGSSLERSRTFQSDSFGDDAPVSPPPSKRSRTNIPSSGEPVHSPTINLEDNDEEGFTPHSSLRRIDSHRSTRSRDARPTTTPSRVKAEPNNTVLLDSDSEPELITDIKGKSKAVTREKSASPPLPQPNKYQRFIDEAEARRKNQAKAGRSNVFLQVLVNSTIPGAQPLTFKLRIDQPLRVMLNHWAVSQRKSGHPDFPIHSQEETDELIVTFNKARVFPDSSLQILGIRADAEGNILNDGRTHDRDALYSNGKGVILEIWTLASFKQMEIDEELRRKREMGELSEEEEVEEAVEESQPVKVKLVAKGMEVVRASVKPEYSVETLVSVFRKSRDVGSGTEITLYFDGEKLEEHMTIEDADIQDMDTIEVYLK